MQGAHSVKSLESERHKPGQHSLSYQAESMQRELLDKDYEIEQLHRTIRQLERRMSDYEEQLADLTRERNELVAENRQITLEKGK